MTSSSTSPKRRVAIADVNFFMLTSLRTQAPRTVTFLTVPQWIPIELTRED